jgi:hypothetical protein
MMEKPFGSKWTIYMQGSCRENGTSMRGMSNTIMLLAQIHGEWIAHCSTPGRVRSSTGAYLEDGVFWRFVSLFWQAPAAKVSIENVSIPVF